MFRLFTTLFDNLGVKYSYSYLKQLIEEMPYNDSMFGVGVILDKYNVSHRCVKFINKNRFTYIEVPFIAIYKRQFILVSSISSDGVIGFYIDGQYQQTSFDQFCQGWNGVAILIIPDNNIREENYHVHIIEQRQSAFKDILSIIVAIVLMGFGVLNVNSELSWVYNIIIAINAGGLFVSFLLLQKQLHIPNKVADKICGLSKESSCADILESKAATLLGIVKLGEVGFGFFATNIIVLLCFPQAHCILAIYAILVLPFSFWSVWYQRFRARKWCPLCLCILAIMWAQALTYLAIRSLRDYSGNLTAPIMIVMAYVLFVLCTNMIMNLISSKKRADDIYSLNVELKYSDTVINAFLNKGIPYNISAKECSSLIFGNEDAEKTITIFSNPYCGPCALMHNKIKELPLNCIRVQYVLTYFSDDKSIINKAIIAAYQQLGSDATWQILSDWFAGGQKQGVDFFSKFNIAIDTPEVEAEFKKQSEWSNDERLIGTPTDLVNGREIVWPYTIEDYTYLY